jgi:glycosyltransferase involved in cell wall biosynthesis
VPDTVTVLFPITDLSRDGAQRQLLELVKGLDTSRFRPVVASLQSGGPMEEEFKTVLRDRMVSLERRGKYDFSVFFKMLAIMRKFQVDIVQPFLTPAVFFSLLPTIFYPTKVKIVTERCSSGIRNLRLGYRLFLKAEDILSHFADVAVSNSEAGRRYLIERGIKPGLIRVIYNGIDFDRLTSRIDEAIQVRQNLGVSLDGKIVGMMARMFPHKRHDIFLRSAASIKQAIPDTKFVLLGDGPLRNHLETLSQDLGLNSSVIFLGEQLDVGPFLAAFDIAVLPSEAEGCSNTLLEAMALGKPVVATDVGGNRELVNTSETGLLVPLDDVATLTDAVIGLLRDPGRAQTMGLAARDKVFTLFNIPKMVQEYQSLWEQSLDNRMRRNGATAISH